MTIKILGMKFRVIYLLVIALPMFYIFKTLLHVH